MLTPRLFSSVLGDVTSKAAIPYRVVASNLRPFATVLNASIPQQQRSPPQGSNSIPSNITPLPLSAAGVQCAQRSATQTASDPTYRVQPIPEYPVPATISLASGASFTGHCYGAPVSSAGEVVFTTALVGYPESLTDPSYAGQILVLTQPLAGNYGVPAPRYDQGLAQFYESSRIHARAVVVQNYTWQFSHRDATMSLGAWCASHGVPLLSGIDTRELVRILRSSGSTMGAIQVDNGPLVSMPPEVNGPDLVASVSTRAPVVFGQGAKYKVAVLDFGAKHNILRRVIAGNQGDTEVTLFPWNYPIQEVIDKYHGLVLSNGPGDPRHMTVPVTHVHKLLEAQAARPDSLKVPILGICMGNQVLGMAAGLNTYKLKYGNRGHNQPCLNLINGGCVITSQNHGYALDDSKMPPNWKTYFRNANDGSNEGIWAAGGRWRAVQFHPEAWGGPTDTMHLFDSFSKDVKEYYEHEVLGKIPIRSMQEKMKPNVQSLLV